MRCPALIPSSDDRLRQLIGHEPLLLWRPLRGHLPALRRRLPLNSSAFGHAAAGRDDVLGFWPAASDVATAKTPPTPPTPPTPTMGGMDAGSDPCKCGNNTPGGNGGKPTGGKPNGKPEK